MKKVILIISVSLLFFSGASFSEDNIKKAEREREVEKSIFMASGIQDRVLKIGLVDCITYALKSNLQIKIKHIEPRLKQDDIRIAWSAFEPTFTGDFDLSDNSKPSPLTTLFSPPHSKTRITDFDAGVEGKIITGAKYKFDFLNEKTKSNSNYQLVNPYYTSEPKIVVTQPLFRNFGIQVNKADIYIAQNNKQISEESFKDRVMEIITNTKIYYGNYMYRLFNYALAVSTWERAKDLFDINKLRYAKGLVSSVDLLETEADAISKERLVIGAEEVLKKSEDDLKLITNLVDDPEAWNAKIELIDKIEFKFLEVDLMNSLQAAFKYRPDYISAKVDLKNKDIKIMTAKNALLPTVDLTGSLGLNGVDKHYPDTLANISTKHKDWGIGVEVNIPWGEGDRAKFDQRKQELTQALIEIKDLEQNIILDVRDKVRKVNTQKRQVEASLHYKEKEAENYEAQKERYAAGQVSTHDMIDYQNKLATSELEYNKAVLDYYTALFNLEKSEGLTLVKNDIKLEEQ